MKACTGQVVERILDMVTILHLGPWSRAELARRWGVTPRQVSNVIERADEWLGVRVRYEADYGYRLLDAGVVDIRRIGRVMSRQTGAAR